MKLRRTKEWYERHPNPLAFYCCYAAIGSTQLYDLLASLSFSPEFKKTVKIRNPLDWPRLYKNHRRLTSKCLDTLLTMSIQQGREQYEIELFRHLKEELTSQKPFSTRHPPKPIRRFLLRLFRPKDHILFNYLEKMVEEEDQDESKRLSELEKLHSIPEMAFFTTVLMPCWFEYRELVTPLFRRARQGDLEAIEKILWLDKNAIHDPQIAKEWHLASQKPQGVRFQRMNDALVSSPRIKLTPEKVKIWMSGLILLVSEAFAHRLQTPEIRRLFDALAYDLHGQLYDSDITLEEDAFRMAVNREKKLWKPFVKEVVKRLGP